MPAAILATVSPSDGIDDFFYKAVLICFVLAALPAFTAWLGGWLAPGRSRLCKGVAVAAILLSLYPICFATYIHHIDYAPVEIDGTKASGPLWKRLWLPCVPLVMGVIYLVRCGFRS